MLAVGTRSRLSVMMAAVYAIQGAFWPVLAIHLQDLGIAGRVRGLIFGTLAMSSLVTPLIAGRLADRRFPAQRILACIYAVGTVLLASMCAGWIRGPWGLFATFMGYWLLTAPAFGLASTIALRNLRDPSAQFGGVRMWGTIGWMCVGWVVSLVMLSRGDGRGAFEAFGVSACLSAFLTVFALFLPDTPPAPAPAGEPRRRGWREVSAVLAQPSVGLLVAIAFGACLTTPFVYQVVPAYLRTLGLPRPWVPLAMSLGQVLEIGALLLLPRALRAFGFRGVMTFGLSAWILYHGLMAANPPLPLAIVGLPIQGLAIACFHIAGLMYLDTQAPSDGRAAMQGLYLTATAGCGSLLGSLFAGEVVARNGAVTAAVFRAPLLLNVVLIALFALAFRARPPRVTESHSVEEVERSADLSTCAKRVGRPRRRKRPQVVR